MHAIDIGLRSFVLCRAMDKTVIKAFGVLEALARHERPQRVSELSRELDLVKSNTHRLLRTLVELGYVRQDARGLYAPTSRIWEVGSTIVARLPVQRAATDHLRRLAAATTERVHLSILDGMDVIYLQGIEAEHPVRIRATVGYRAPAYLVATGKAMLAYQAEAVIRTAARLAQTATAGLSAERFRAQLAEIRRQGFAITLGAWRSTIHGLAAPITNPDASIDAAISVSGPAERLDAKRLRGLAPLVVETAQAIAHDLAYNASRGETAPPRQLPPDPRVATVIDIPHLPDNPE